MLVSHSHKFILIKSKKTAGSSIQNYLAKYCKDGIVETHFPGSHRSAVSTKEKVGEEIWNSYLKICPIRNPWDKMVSWYFWRGRKRSFLVKIKRILQGRDPQNEAWRMNFKDYIKWMLEYSDVNIDSGVIFIDKQFPDYFYIRYERLNEDLKLLCDKLKIPFEADRLPQEKVGTRKVREYKSFYDEETKEIVRKAYQREIDKFKYTFE